MIIKESLANATQVAYIKASDMKSAYPLLFNAYKNYMEGKNPKISLYVTEKYSYTPIASQPEVDYYRDTHYLLYKEGKVLHYYEGDPIESSPTKPGVYFMEYGDVALEFSTGYYTHCNMYVSPQTVNQLALEEDKALDPLQEFVLVCLKSYMSSYRKKSFIEQMRGYGYLGDDQIVSAANSDFFYDGRKELLKLYKEVYESSYDNIVLSLQGHGLAKVSSNGATAITIEGKNRVLKIKEESSKRWQIYHDKNK
jgi:hypothetical protein